MNRLLQWSSVSVQCHLVINFVSYVKPSIFNAVHCVSLTLSLFFIIIKKKKISPFLHFFETMFQLRILSSFTSMSFYDWRIMTSLYLAACCHTTNRTPPGRCNDKRDKKIIKKAPPLILLFRYVNESVIYHYCNATMHCIMGGDQVQTTDLTIAH